MRRDKFLPRMLGFNVQGDLGPWTFYTNKNRKIVFYPQAPPLRPASYAQRACRNRMVRAGYQWRSLPRDQRDNWNKACRRAYLETVGFGLFFWFAQSLEIVSLVNIERISGTPLLTNEVKSVLQIHTP